MGLASFQSNFKSMNSNKNIVKNYLKNGNTLESDIIKTKSGGQSKSLSSAICNQQTENTKYR